MIRRVIYAFAAVCLIAMIGISGFFVPELVLKLQDKKTEGSTETPELGEVFLNYGTEPTLAEKLKLIRDRRMIYAYQIGEYNLTYVETEQKVMSFLSSVLDFNDGNEAVCYSEPQGILFDNGETLVLWNVHVVCGSRFEGEFILDDKSGLILRFYISDILLREEIQDTVVEAEEFSLPDVTVLAEKLIESYGMLNCRFEDGHLYIPLTEAEDLKLKIWKYEYGISFNNS